MEREYWVMMQIKSGKPVNYYVALGAYMPVDSGLFSRVEVFDGPYPHGDTARAVADEKNAEIDRERATSWAS